MAVNLGFAVLMIESQTAPDTRFIWRKIDAQGNLLDFLEYKNGAWQNVGAIAQIIDGLNSTLTNAAGSANNDRILNQKIANLLTTVGGLEQNFFDALTDYVAQNTANKPNGYLKLDQFGQLPAEFQQTDDRQFEGYWDPNSDEDPTENPENGQYWIVSASGNYGLGTITSFDQFDQVAYVNGAWQKSPGVNLAFYNDLDSNNQQQGLAASVGPQIEALINAVNTALADEITRINALQQSVADAEAERAALSDTIDTLNAGLTALSSALTALDDRVSDLSTGTTTTREEITLQNGSYYNLAFDGKSLSDLRLKYRIEHPGQMGNLLMADGLTLTNGNLAWQTTYNGTAYLETISE